MNKNFYTETYNELSIRLIKNIRYKDVKDELGHSKTISHSDIIVKLDEKTYSEIVTLLEEKELM